MKKIKSSFLVLTILLAFAVSVFAAAGDYRWPLASGTGTGDVFYSSGGYMLNLPLGTAGKILQAGASAPAWSSFTIPTSGTTGDIVVFTSGTVIGKLSQSTAGLWLRSAGASTAAAWSSTILPNASTTGDVMYSSGTNTFAALNAGATAGMFLRNGGATTAPAWSTLVLPNAATTGDIAVATSANTVGVVAAVATGQVLASAGASTVPAYTASPSVTSVTTVSLNTTPVAITIANDAVGGRSASYNFTPTASCYAFTNNDPDGIAAITWFEGGAVAGQLLTIYNAATYTIQFTDQAGVINATAGGMTLAAEDTWSGLYTGSVWVETGRADN
jgi:hypothetical protein